MYTYIHTYARTRALLHKEIWASCPPDKAERLRELAREIECSYERQDPKLVLNYTTYVIHYTVC